MAALLLCAPKVCKDGPNVRLLAGSWTVKTRGLTNSHLSLLVNGAKISLASEVHKLTLSKPSEAIVRIEKCGNEDLISVIAVRTK